MIPKVQTTQWRYYTTYGTLNNWWCTKQRYLENTMQGKAATAEQWTDTSLLRCFAHNAVQCCSADAAMHDTLQGSSCTLLWFHEALCSFLFHASLQFCHTLKEEVSMEEAQRMCHQQTDFRLFHKVSEHNGNSCLRCRDVTLKQTREGPGSSLWQIQLSVHFCFLWGFSNKSLTNCFLWSWKRRRNMKLAEINIQK